MPRNTVYKQVCRITLTGDDIINNDTYKAKNTNVFNSTKLRFNLSGSLNHIRLSSNARAILETCNIPSIVNLAGNYALLRLVTSTNDICFDTKAFLGGNPIILSTPTSATANANNFVYNCSEFFYNINIPSTFLQQGYIDLQLEVPTQTTNNIGFNNALALISFFLTLIIIDEDPEVTNNSLLAPDNVNNQPMYSVKYP